MRKSVVAVMLVALTALPVHAQTAAPPEKLDLARRLLDAMKGTEGSVAFEMELQALYRGRSLYLAAAPGEYAKAMRQTLDEQAAPYIAQVQERRARIYASDLSADDLRALLAYHENPLVQSAREKRNAVAKLRAAGDTTTRGQPLTREEGVALNGLDKELAERQGRVSLKAMADAWTLNRAIANDTARWFCVLSSRCGFSTLIELSGHDLMLTGWRIADAVEGPLAESIEQAMLAAQNEQPFSVDRAAYLNEIRYKLARFRIEIQQAEEKRAQAYADAFGRDDWTPIGAVINSPPGIVALMQGALAEKAAKARAAGAAATAGITAGVHAMVKYEFCNTGTRCTPQMRDTVSAEADKFLQTLYP